MRTWPQMKKYVENITKHIVKTLMKVKDQEGHCWKPNDLMTKVI